MARSYGRLNHSENCLARPNFQQMTTGLDHNVAKGIKKNFVSSSEGGDHAVVSDGKELWSAKSFRELFSKDQFPADDNGTGPQRR
ncbi:hypothetical protein DICVIV_12504 [Dictyocaulus viviparus]|uniref:Uncharacterized protein n=1 Tax=Dictyocaulus viviparus TaxID=29172 RepID=A0A0D8XCX9_DICVI|nr:hypothetical protein DICVIV_12504 [Dictyocaulus viviparus]